jgi:mono/diheme cytochrome c family protein
VGIGVDGLDVPRAALIGHFGDRAHEGKVIGMAGHAHQLAWLEVDPDLDGEARVAHESLFRSHSSAAYTDGRSFSRTRLWCRGSVPAVLLSITTTGKVTLLVVAGLFIAWALITAIWIPKRNADFPATLTAFILVSSLFLVAQLGAVYWVTSTQEVETEAAGEATPGEGTPAETTPTETNSGETPEAGADADVVAGKEVFESAGCVGCHTLADAGATGTVGPNLDEAKPSAELVVTRVTNGMGAMPPFKGQLSDQQIKDVAAYVSSVAGKS